MTPTEVKEGSRGVASRLVFRRVASGEITPRPAAPAGDRDVFRNGPVYERPDLIHDVVVLPVHVGGNIGVRISDRGGDGVFIGSDGRGPLQPGNQGLGDVVGRGQTGCQSPPIKVFKGTLPGPKVEPVKPGGNNKISQIPVYFAASTVLVDGETGKIAEFPRLGGVILQRELVVRSKKSFGKRN